MDIQMVIDGVVRLVALGDSLPFDPSWFELKQEMAQSKLFSLEDLEKRQEYIIEKYHKLRIERLEENMAKLLGRPARPKTDSSKDAAAPSEGSNKDSGFNGSSKGSESDEEGSFQPTLDETATAERACIMSICINGRWEGAALEYCREEESFISLRWAQRHHLEMVDGQVRLTWKFNHLDKTYVTQFILLENLDPDFMLGVMSSDEVFNRDNGTSANKSPMPAHSFLDPSAIPMQEIVPPTQVWLNRTVPNIEFLSELMFRLETKYRHSETADHLPRYLPRHQGGVVGEDSSSSSSSVQNHSLDPRRHSPKSRRSHSKSNHCDDL